MELRDRVALVTGGAGGLGAVIARALAAEGAHIALTYREHGDDGRAMCGELEAAGGKALLVHLDQTDPASCVAAVEATVNAFGRLDILINNAAMNQPVPFADLDGLTPEVWDLLLSTNLRGPFLLARAAAAHLKRQNQGRIVNIAEFAGLAPVGSSIALAVSKAGLIHLTHCLAVALAPFIAVNCVAPGSWRGRACRLGSDRKLRAILKCMTDLHDVAQQVVAFCRADSISGQTQVIDGGIVFH